MMNNSSLVNGHSDFEVIARPSAGTSFGTSEMNSPNMNLHLSAGGGSHVTGAGGITPNTPPSVTDLTLDEARQKLIELSQENSELQNYLKENNEMMKRQFETLAEWKKKVEGANINNREKFEQTKKVITSLRQENKENATKVAQLETDLQEKHLQTEDLQRKLEICEEEKQTAERLLADYKHSLSSMSDMQATGANGGEKMEMVMVKLSEEKEAELLEFKNLLKLKDDELKESRKANENLLRDLNELQKLKELIQQDYQKLSRENMELSHKMEAELVCNSYNSMNWMNMVEKLSEEECAASGMNKSVCLKGVDVETKKSSEPVKEAMQQLPMDNIIKRQGAMNQAYEDKIKELQTTIQSINEERDKLNRTIQNKEREMRESKASFDQTLSSTIKQYEKKLDDFSKKLDKDREEQLKSQTMKNETVESMRAQTIELLTEVHELGNKLEAANSAIDRKNQRVKDLEEKHERDKETISSLEMERKRTVTSLQTHISNLQANYKQEHDQHMMTKNEMEEQRKSFNALVDDYKELLTKFEEYRKSQDQETMGEMGKLKEILNKLTCQVIVAEEALTLRDEEVGRLKNELQVLKQEADERLNIYKAQADVYKSDFDAERQAREKQVEEKNAIIREREELRLRYQQLQDEMEVFSSRQIAEMQQRMNSPTRENLYQQTPHGYDYTYPAGQPNTTQSTQPQSIVTQPQDQQEVDFVCPSCDLRCPDLDTLQIHVVDCMNLD